ncbi:MAG: hypothetical protein NTZ92_03710 [Candidatus Omnitrophica bacterium]|nr:hypothetical protein [Candidatus Omnitrophota bacterium]
MKKTIIYAVVLVVVSLAVGAVVGTLFERRSGHARRKHFIEGMREKMKDRREKRPEKVEGVLLNRLTQQLNLTQDQQVKVKAILDDARKGVEVFREGAYKKMADIREETNTKIQGILTADQKEKFTKIISDLKERQGKGKCLKPGGPRPPGGPDIE